MIESYSIRPVIREDAPALAYLLHSLGYFDRLKDKPLEQTTAPVTAALDNVVAGEAHTLLVAVGIDGQLLGYTAVH